MEEKRKCTKVIANRIGIYDIRQLQRFAERKNINIKVYVITPPTDTVIKEAKECNIEIEVSNEKVDGIPIDSIVSRDAFLDPC